MVSHSGCREKQGEMKEHWRDAYFLALFVVSAFMGFSRWIAAFGVAMWIVFAILNWIAFTRSRWPKN